MSLENSLRASDGSDRGDDASGVLSWNEVFTSHGQPQLGLDKASAAGSGRDRFGDLSVGVIAGSEVAAKQQDNAGGRFERAAFAQAIGADLGSQRAYLDSLAQARLSRKELERLRGEMVRFEDRARTRGLSADEVARTYQQTARLLEVDGDQFLEKKARVIAAQQVVRNAANPTLVDNGFHKTCNVASIESRTYTMYPSDAAKLVADVATAGEYTTTDGTVIKVGAQSLKADNEASDNPPRDGARGYASQIFQVAAVNVFWQRQVRDPQGNVVPKGSIRYEQSPTRVLTDTGERLVSYANGKPEDVKDRKGNVIRQPQMRTNDVVETSNQITGRNETDVLIENTNKPDNGWRTLDAGTEAELKAMLIDLKTQGRLPAIIAVHTGNEPFKSDSRATTSSSGVWHVLSVTDIDAATGKVSVDNEWGTRADHIGKKPIDVALLYKATLEPGARKKNQMEIILGIPDAPVIVGDSARLLR